MVVLAVLVVLENPVLLVVKEQVMKINLQI